MKIKKLFQYMIVISVFFSASITHAVLGDMTEPASSCYAIKQSNPSATDGLYWLQNGSMTAPKQYYCDMTTSGGGWQLLFQRRGGDAKRNTESCGSTVNEFLHAGSCGNVTSLAYGDSYNPDNVNTTISDFAPAEYLSVQFNSAMLADSDDAYVIQTTQNLFPDSPSPSQTVDIPVDAVCDVNGLNCDTTDVYWKYIGDSWFHSSLCRANFAANNTGLNGNYGYCHNGWTGTANSLFGDRQGYGETKLWNHNNGSRTYMERVFIRPDVGNRVPSDITLSNQVVLGGITLVGDLSTVDADASDTHSYTLVSGTGSEDNAFFAISASGTLSFINAPDASNPLDTGDTAGNNTYSIRVRTTDSGSPAMSYEKTFVIQVDSSTVAKSCYAIKQSNPSATDGLYWLQNGSMTAPKQYYCDMTTSGGGWQLLFQRRGGANNTESCGVGTNSFLHSSCGDVRDIAYGDSYNADDVETTIGDFSAYEYAVIQYDNTLTADTDDAYIISSSNNLFPNLSTAAVIDAAQICHLDGTNCDTASVQWVYAPYGWWNSNYCHTGWSSSQTYKGMYGPCHNGASVTSDSSIPNLNVNSFNGDRDPTGWYAQTKLWGLGGGSNSYMERVFIRPKSPVFQSITLESDNAKNTTYAKVGDRIKITIALEEDDTWKSSYNKPTFSIGASSSLQTTNYLGSSGGKQSGYRNYTVLPGQNGTLTFTALDFKNRDDVSVSGFVAPYVPAANIIVDTTAPLINFTDDVSAALVPSDNITVTVTDDHLDTSSYSYGFSTDAVCDASDSYPRSFSSGVSFSIATSTHNGQYVCAKAEDAAGNVSYKVSTHPLLVGLPTATPTVAPDLASSSDSGVSNIDNITQNNTPTFEGSCVANSVVTMYVDNVQTTATTTCSAADDFSVTLNQSLTNGTHDISFTQKQNSIAYQESDQSPALSVVIDTLSPTNLILQVDVDTPRDIDNPQIAFSATDDQSGISHYTIQIDGGAVTTQVSPYMPALMPASSHTVVVHAYDRAGNSTSKTVQYPPTVNIDSPTVIINTSITDTVVTISGPNPITGVSLSGASYTNLNCAPAIVPTGTVGPVTCNLVITGSGTLTITATDSASSTGTASQNYTIETDNPVIAFAQDVEPGPVRSDDVELHVVDANPDVSSYRYGFSTDAVCDASDSYLTGYIHETAFTVNTEIYNGQYICAQAKDLAGNISYQASAHPLNIDDTPAMASIAYSTTSATNQSVALTLTASEDIVTPIGWTQLTNRIFTKQITANQTVNFSITDLAGNTTALSYSVGNIDTENPNVSLNGSNPQTVLKGSGYVEAGASCADNDSCAVSVSGTVDSNTVGSYTVTYTASDPAGNSVQANRVVQVVAGSNPVITLTGVNPQVLQQGQAYSELGASAVDTEDGDISVSIIVDTSNLNVNEPGSYTVHYTVSDSSANTASSSRSVIVKKKASVEKSHYVCRDPKATNYQRFGRSDSRLCRYGASQKDDKNQDSQDVNNRTDDIDARVQDLLRQIQNTKQTDSESTVCPAYLQETISLGGHNNPDEVNKLITFLNKHMNLNLAVDGSYDRDDFEAVKQFQTRYASSVLEVWGLKKATGYVYTTTRMKINALRCQKVQQCPVFTQYHSARNPNHGPQVGKTQQVLKDLGFYQGDISNQYNQSTIAAMIRFQETFHQTMLKPWGLTRGTGYQYKTTNKFLNELVGCTTQDLTLENGATVSY